jgi:hypothetical protein
MVHTLSTVHVSRFTVGAMTERGVASTPRGQGPRHSGEMCIMRISQSSSEHRIMSLGMTIRQIPAFGWKTITSCAGWVGQMMTSSSSCAYPFN